MHSTKSSKTLLRSWQFEALGTAWSIETPQELPINVREEIAERIEQFDASYSRFRKDSLVGQLRTPGKYVFPSDVTDLLTLYKKLYEMTDGRMTPLIGGMLEDAGYDATYSLQPKLIHDIPDFDALGWDGATTLQPTRPIVLDVGAAGKGYLVDSISEILELHGVTEYVIDASGDIKQKGDSQIVGLEHPLDLNKVIGTVTLQDQSLCASAVNRRAWLGMHHVFDPNTKMPTNSMMATWVIAESTFVADALATALFFVAADTLLNEFEFTYVTISTEGAIDVSPQFNGKLYI